MSIKDKFMYGLIVPVQLWMNLTVPILDEDDMNKSWNKATTLLQVNIMINCIIRFIQNI